MFYRTRMTGEYIEKLHKEALMVLKEIGMSVENDLALKLLSQKGLKVTGTRVFFEPEFVEERLRQINCCFGTANTQPYEEVGDKIALSPNAMPLYYLNPYTGKTEPMTLVNLVQSAKFIETLKDDNFANYVPGVPVDVPEQLSSLTECYIGAEFTSSAGNVDTYYPEETLPYLFEMLEALGQKRYGGMFVVSPLRLVGSEFDIVVRNIDKFESFGVGSLPAVGISSPIYPDIAWVVAIAEAVGGAVVLHVLCDGKKSVNFYPGLYAFDLRTMAITVSAPEETLMSYEAYLIARWYGKGFPYGSSIFTSAKYPGLQAGAEKYLNGGFALALGCRNFSGAGGLSEYDIFSPEQAIFDVEIRNMMERLIKITPAPPDGDWLDIIREGIADGYMNTETTLLNYKDFYSYPKYLDRTTVNMYLANDNFKKLEDTMREAAIARIEGYSYKPLKENIEDVRRIFNIAWEKLSGGVKNPFEEMVEKCKI